MPHMDNARRSPDFIRLNIAQFCGALIDNVFKLFAMLFLIRLHGPDSASSVTAIASDRVMRRAIRSVEGRVRWSPLRVGSASRLASSASSEEKSRSALRHWATRTGSKRWDSICSTC